MRRYIYRANDLEGTDRLGQALADFVPPGTTIALYGTLGAGKTRLVQAMAEACGIPRDVVVSPTFVLCHEHHGTKTLYHLDAYRIADDDEFLQLGPEEFFESAGVTLIEWADRVQDCLPVERLEVHLEVTGETERRFEVSATTEDLSDIVTRIERYFAEA